ncbi:MAG: TonB family protein [Pseudoxanthomonas sp.]
MKPLFAMILSGFLLATSGPGHAAVAGKDVREAWLRASIVLDANGKLTSLEWIDAKPNDRLVTTPLEAVVQDWEFEPGMLDGIPAVTETGLLLHVKLKKTNEGGIALEIDDARTGAISQSQAPPKYPIDQAKRGAQARVVMRIETDEAGNFASASVMEYVGSSGASTSRKDFESAALKAVKTWNYRTGRVGSVGLRATLRVPISFCMDNWCERKQPEDTNAESPSGVAVATDSVARIKTRTSRVEIQG